MEKIAKALKNKFDFWEERTGDIPTTNYIAVREIASDGLLKGKITHYSGSDQLIVENKGKVNYDSNRASDFYDPNSKQSAMNYVLRNLDLNKVKITKNK
jgi:hypothetical protein